jgi:GrpB-like predicted nucleotidyltransferase (UPF0157 family)
LLEYDSGWALRFEELAARVRAFLGDSVCHVEHIGSTAVPGLTAKPGEERHHLYLLVYGAPEFQRHLAFRRSASTLLEIASSD